MKINLMEKVILNEVTFLRYMSQLLNKKIN